MLLFRKSRHVTKRDLSQVLLFIVRKATVMWKEADSSSKDHEVWLLLTIWNKIKQDWTSLNKFKNQRPKTKNKNVINFWHKNTPLPLLLTLPILSSNMWILQLTAIVLIWKEKKKIFLSSNKKKVMSTSWRNKISSKCHLYDIWLIFECQNSGLILEFLCHNSTFCVTK